jgi:hypothetical protein
MENLITINDKGIPVFNPEIKLIKEYSAIIRRDKGSPGDHDGREKRMATKELAYIYFYGSYKSPYYKETEEVRYHKVKNALDLPEDWKPDELIQAGIDRWEELQRTDAMLDLEAAKKAAKQTRNYLNNVDYDLHNDKGVYKYKVKEVTDTIKTWGLVLKGIDDLEERVKKDMELTANKIRGGGQKNKREDPNSVLTKRENRYFDEDGNEY